MLKKFKTLQEVMTAFKAPQAAVRHFTKIRWKNGKFCPHCGHDHIYKMKPFNRYRCAQCKTNFSVTVGTIFEDTKLPLRLWFGAIWLLTNHPKGIASTTLARDLGVTQKTAWFMLHRLRHAARTKSFNAPLAGKVEVDESYIGGNPRNYSRQDRKQKKRRKKAVVVGAVERGGPFIGRHVEDASQQELQGFIHDTVSPAAKLLVTDASRAYFNLSGYLQHEVVNHQKGEWKRGDAHTNTIESVWAQLKRQINGTHHWVSEKHLQKYVDEMAWRMDPARRSMSGEERVNALFSDVEGRLTYKALIG